MSSQLEGKVAFITGAARGQGRSHAVRFAEEGADIIAFDLCEQMDSVAYPMATPEDLDETVNLVEKTGRRIVAEQGDVRDFGRLKAAVANGVDELGRIDFVLANAGILPACGEQMYEIGALRRRGRRHAQRRVLHHRGCTTCVLENGDGGAIVITSSTAGLNGLCPQFSLLNHGLAGYQAAKHGVVGLMRYYATALAEKNIRVNTVHPTGVATPMLLNEPIDQFFKERPEALSGTAEPLTGGAHRRRRHQRGDGLPVRAIRPVRHRHHAARRWRAGCQKVTVS